ncbi:MAG TPA: hypothetical protein VJB95_00670 [Candidatus Paceibacterota bacterium]
MKKEIKRKINNQSGAAMMIAVIFFLFISLAIISGLVSPSIREFKNANQNLNSKKSYFLAESGSEDAVYRILTGKSIGTSETIVLDFNSATTSITSISGSQKEIVSLGEVRSNHRKTFLTLTEGEGVVFKYGSQAGQGGIVFHNNSYLDGSFYSNGDIIGSNGAYITGDAFVAGSSGSISNMRVGYGGTGDARAHTVTGSTITGALYCQTGSGNNKSCNTSQADPEDEDMPITDEEISEWKNDASSGGTTSGNVTISSPTTLGPRKIAGNLTVNDTLTVAGTLYVTGNITISDTVRLATSYGATSAIIIADGYIIINGGVDFEDSGTTGSYIMLLSESSCDESMSGDPCNGRNAIEVNNNSSISIVNAQKGTIYFKNNAGVKEVVANKIELKNNVGVEYGSGIINVNFTSGPGGGWILGTWKETE